MRKWVANFTFHGIGPPRENLSKEDELVWISEDLFKAVLDKSLQYENIRFSFDDGNRSDIEIALPELRQRNLTAHFFVCPPQIGQPDRIDESETRELVAAGMTIGTHGMDHIRWQGLSDRQIELEFFESKKRLEEVTGKEVTTAACPFGAYDRRTLHALRRFGYTQVFTSDLGLATEGHWLQARSSLTIEHTPEFVEQTIQRYKGTLQGFGLEIKKLVKRWR